MRRAIFALAAALAIVAALLVGGWFVLAGRLDAGVQAWISQRRSEGYVITHETVGRYGFPLRVGLLLSNPTVTSPVGVVNGGTATWRATALGVELVPWQLDRIVLRAQGRGDAELQQPDAVLALQAEDMVAELGGSTPTTVRLRSGALELRGAALPLGATGGAAELILPRVAPGDHTQTSAELTLELRGAVTPLATPAPVDVQGRFSVMGAVPPGRPAAALAAWRDQGGVIEIRQLRLVSGDVVATGTGTVALDRAMRPMGAGSLILRGWDALIDSLIAARVLRDRDARLARMSLTALAQPMEDGTQAVTLPVAAQDGWLSIGPIRIARLAPVRLE